MKRGAPMTPTDVDVIVVGGGISGLAAAFGAQQRGASVEVLDAGARAGGVIGTVHRDGALYEAGPNSALDTTPLINELLDALGIRGERADASAVASTRFIVRGGKLVALPMSPGAFLTTPAFTLGAKLRLLREPFIAPAPPDVEESIAAFVRRRLGTEFLDYAIDPFVSGVYAGDPEQISVPAAFPRLHALEQKYGSLIKGQIKGARERRRSAEKAKNTAGSFSFRAGMQTLTDALARAVGRVATGVRVHQIVRDPDGTWTVAGTRDGAPVVRRARAVVLAAPAYAAAELVRDLAPAAAQGLAAIPLRAGRQRRERLPSRRHRAFARGLRLPRAEEGAAPDPGLAVLEQHVRGPRAGGHGVAHVVHRRPAQSRAAGEARRGARGDRARRARRRSSAPAASRCGRTSRAGRTPFRNTISATANGCAPSRTPSARCPASSSARAIAAGSRWATASSRRTRWRKRSPASSVARGDPR